MYLQTSFINLVLGEEMWKMVPRPNEMKEKRSAITIEGSCLDNLCQHLEQTPDIVTTTSPDDRAAKRLPWMAKTHPRQPDEHSTAHRSFRRRHKLNLAGGGGECVYITKLNLSVLYPLTLVETLEKIFFILFTFVYKNHVVEELNFIAFNSITNQITHGKYAPRVDAEIYQFLYKSMQWPNRLEHKFSNISNSQIFIKVL